MPDYPVTRQADESAMRARPDLAFARCHRYSVSDKVPRREPRNDGVPRKLVPHWRGRMEGKKKYKVVSGVI